MFFLLYSWGFPGRPIVLVVSAPDGLKLRAANNAAAMPMVRNAIPLIHTQHLVDHLFL